MLKNSYQVIKRSLCVCGLVAAVSGVSFTAQADEYTFVSLQFPPLSYTEKGENKPKGMSVELVSEAFKRMGHTINIKVQTWARSLNDVKEGKADAIFTAYKNPERETFLDYSKEVVVPQQVSMFVSKGSNLTADKMGYSGDASAFSKYSIGVRNKISYGATIDKMLKENSFKKIDKTNTPESNIKKLAKGRVELMPMNRYVAWHLAKSIGMNGDIAEIQPPVQSIPSYIAFSKKRNLASLRDAFDKEFRKMIEDGTYDRIVKKYTQ